MADRRFIQETYFIYDGEHTDAREQGKKAGHAMIKITENQRRNSPRLAAKFEELQATFAAAGVKMKFWETYTEDYEKNHAATLKTWSEDARKTGRWVSRD